MQAFLTRTPRKKPECPRPSNLAVISFLITTIYFHIHFEFFFLNKVSKLYKFQDPRNLDRSLRGLLPQPAHYSSISLLKEAIASSGEKEKSIPVRAGFVQGSLF